MSSAKGGQKTTSERATLSSIYQKDDFETLTQCPWCEAKAQDSALWCHDEGGFESVQCYQCGVIYVRVRLNATGRVKYYKHYYSDVHQAQKDLSTMRQVMYRIDIDFIKRFVQKGRVLDIGCSGGEFLQHFDRQNWERWGVELGEDAARQAQKVIGDKVYQGDFLKMGSVLPGQTFDLISMRGVLEHVPEPRQYLEKAVSLLKPKGKLFIGATPNRDALCAHLFKNKWNQHAPDSHIFHFSPNDFKAMLIQHGVRLLNETHFYLETPYAQVDADFGLIKKAIEASAKGKPVDFMSPAFWGNLMTLIFERSAS